MAKLGSGGTTGGGGLYGDGGPVAIVRRPWATGNSANPLGCSTMVLDETHACGASRGTYFADSITKADEYARRKAVGSVSACLAPTSRCIKSKSSICKYYKRQAYPRARDRWRRVTSLDVELQRSAEHAGLQHAGSFSKRLVMGRAGKVAGRRHGIMSLCRERTGTGRSAFLHGQGCPSALS